MAATRNEELVEKARLANLALRLNQQANPYNFNMVSQSSSAYLERKKTEELSVNDQAVAKMITFDLAKADETPNHTHGVIAAALVKSIELPMPSSAEQDAKEKIALDDILPPELLDLIADYKPFAYDEMKKEDKPSNNPSANHSYKAAKASFFGKNLAYIRHQAANDILDGSQAAVDRVVALIKSNPSHLLYPTEGCDRLGRRVQGKLLQIAAMAGDVNIRELKEGEKQHRGIVELLQEAGNLSSDDVAKQLHQVLFSEKAIKANEARNERILAAVERFGDGILQTGIAMVSAEIEVQWPTEVFQAVKKKCEPAFNAFRATLQATVNDVVVSGYVFDTSILHQAMTRFQKKNNLVRFAESRTLASDVFWLNGIGLLQCILSSRDAQVGCKGISFAVKQGGIPERYLENTDSSLLFDSSATTGLGVDFYFGYYGKEDCSVMAGCAVWKTYFEQKHQRCKTYATSGQFKAEQVSNKVTRF